MEYVLSENKTEKGLTIAVFVHNFYSLLDAVFLFLFLSYLTTKEQFRAALQALALIMPPIWYFCYFVLKNAWFEQSTMSAIFDTGYEIILAVWSAAILLEMTNISKAISLSKLWLCIGIFFYNFCVFFIHAFIDDSIIKDVWFLTSVLNIITMVFYAIGFLKASQEKTVSNL